MFNNILLVADDLDHSRQAARMVGETARRMGSSSLCIAVAYPAVPDFLGVPYSEQATAARLTRAEAMARLLLQEVGPIPGEVQAEVLAGTVAEVTRAVSQVRGSDLIVVGSRDRGPLGRLRAWHQGRASAGRALCPVLTVS